MRRTSNLAKASGSGPVGPGQDESPFKINNSIVMKLGGGGLLYVPVG